MHCTLTKLCQVRIYQQFGDGEDMSAFHVLDMKNVVDSYLNLDLSIFELNRQPNFSFLRGVPSLNLS